MVFQMEDAECGAACLAMICAFHGKYVSIEQMRIEVGASRDGASLKNIKLAAQNMGFEVHALRNLKVEQLRELDGPCMLFWNRKHYVVLDGFSGPIARINDPALGRLRVEMPEFERSYSKVALTFEPTASFRASSEPEAPARIARLTMRSLPRALALFVIASLLLVGVSVAAAVMIGCFVDGVVAAFGPGAVSGEGQPLLLIALLAFTLIAGFALEEGCSSLFERLRTRLALFSSRDFLVKMLQLPIGFFGQRYAGDLISRIECNDAANSYLARRFASALSDGPMAVACLVAIALYSWQMALAAAVLIGAYAFAVCWAERESYDARLRLGQEVGQLQGLVFVGLRAIRSLKASGAEIEYARRLVSSSEELSAQERALARRQALASVVSQAALPLSFAMMAFVGGFALAQGAVSPGGFVAVLLLWGFAFGAAKTLLGSAGQASAYEANASRADDVMRFGSMSDLDVHGKTGVVVGAVPGGGAPACAGAAADVHPASRLAGADDEVFRKLSGQVDVESVSFGYGKLGAPVVKDISFSLAPGSLVALTGPSGCGKSTIARIVCGLLEPDEGRVVFDGVSSADIPSMVRAASISVVGQRPTVFAGTVRDNLTLWNPALLESDIVAAARDACLHDDIMQKPGGYNFLLEKDGANLSGGQRQRLEIARALATNPTILILDEATSALDVLTERNVLDNIRRRGCSCIVVAHRPGALRDSDQVLFLRDGMVVESGSHERLLSAGGAYAELTCEGWC